jgi:hypothetical protein
MAVSGVPCPSLAVTGVSVAAEVGTDVGVLRFDIMMVIVPVLEISMLREAFIRRHQATRRELPFLASDRTCRKGSEYSDLSVPGYYCGITLSKTVHQFEKLCRQSSCAADSS